MAQVSCQRCKRETEGLPRAPLPGDVGERVLASTCKECWAEWLKAQVIVINENALSPANPEHYQRLIGEMETFLSLPSPTEG